MTSGSEAGHTDDDNTGGAAAAPSRSDADATAAPSEGVPDVVVDERRLVGAGRAVAAGTGPVAVDAERASGYRYGQRAYLVQLRREPVRAPG